MQNCRFSFDMRLSEVYIIYSFNVCHENQAVTPTKISQRTKLENKFFPALHQGNGTDFSRPV